MLLHALTLFAPACIHTFICLWMIFPPSLKKEKLRYKYLASKSPASKFFLTEFRNSCKLFRVNIKKSRADYPNLLFSSVTPTFKFFWKTANTILHRFFSLPLRSSAEWTFSSNYFSTFFKTKIDFLLITNRNSRRAFSTDSDQSNLSFFYFLLSQCSKE